MKKHILLVALTSALACSTSQEQHAVQAAPTSVKSASDFRNTMPVSGPQPALHAPIPTKHVLANGLTVYSVSKMGLPLVNVALIVRSGSAQDPTALPGLAGFVGEMLKTGTDSTKAEAIADAVESRGTSIEVDVDEDAITVGSTMLKDNFEPVFDVLADIAQHASFNSEEIKRVRSLREAGLKQAQDNPQQAAAQVFRRVVYGEHAYAHMPAGTLNTVKQVARKDLQTYFKRHFRPANAAVVVVGDLSNEDALAAVEKRLGSWKGETAAAPALGAPLEQKPEVTLVPRADAPQSQLMIGELGISRTDPDYFNMVICNAILGGLFNSRINMNLREDKGYTYGARSIFDFMRERGPFFVATGVRTNVTDLAIKEILKEIDTIRVSDVTAEELQNAKSRYSLSLPGYFQTVDGIASMMSTIYMFDLPLDYYQKVPERINAVTVADVRRVAEQHLQPEKLSIVVLGDKNKISTGLTNLQRGPVHERDATGNPAKDAKPAKPVKSATDAPL